MRIWHLKGLTREWLCNPDTAGVSPLLGSVCSMDATNETSLWCWFEDHTAHFSALERESRGSYWNAAPLATVVKGKQMPEVQIALPSFIERLWSSGLWNWSKILQEWSFLGELQLLTGKFIPVFKQRTKAQIKGPVFAQTITKNQPPLGFKCSRPSCSRSFHLGENKCSKRGLLHNEFHIYTTEDGEL